MMDLRMRQIRIAVLGLALCVGSTCHAGPLTCCVIPIADILRHREFFLTYTALGNERNVDAGTHKFYSANVGLFDRAEIGVDSGPAGESLYHGAIQIFEDSKHLDSAFTIGVQNVGRKGYCEPYAIGRIGLKRVRLHAGTLRNDRWRLIAGMDSQLGDWTLATDFTSGPGGIIWAGAGYSLPTVPGLFVGLYVGMPLRHSDGIQNMLYASYTFRR